MDIINFRYITLHLSMSHKKLIEINAFINVYKRWEKKEYSRKYERKNL